MSLKRMSLRFHLDNAADRSAWEFLQNCTGSRNKAVIDAINVSFRQDKDLAAVVRDTIQECLQGLSITADSTQPAALSTEESELLDALDDFLGG